MMLSPELELKEAIGELLKELVSIDINSELILIQKTRPEFEGDLTLVVFPLVRLFKLSPEETANIIGKHIQKQVFWVKGFNVVKGFLNLEFESEYWINRFYQINSISHFGITSEKSGKKVMVEYSSPNTNKPLHLGHLRNNFLGYAVAEILKANGHEVFKVQIINDRGIHICKSMLAWLKFGNGETPSSSGIKGDHLVGKYYVEFDKQYKKEINDLISGGNSEEEAKRNAPLIIEAQEMLKKWENGDEEIRALWNKLNTWVYEGFKETYHTMGVDFDHLYYESDTYLIGKEIIEKNKDKAVIFQKEDGSIWINLEEEGLDNKLLLRSDGTSVYITQDIGTAIQRHSEYDCSEYYYVVGNEQDYHFKVLAAILGRMGYSWSDGIKHLSYGMVDLPKGKMKSREGTVVDADDLMKEMVSTAKSISEELGKLDSLPEEERLKLFKQIGLGALKYFILKVDPKKRMLFDPKESIDFNGNTGPFIQYAYARINSMVNKQEYVFEETLDSAVISKMDLSLIKKLDQFPEIIKEAGDQKSPALVANYLYDLVKEFNHYYQNTPPILKESNLSLKGFRLELVKKTGELIKTGMSLLGIEVPNQM